MKPLHASLRGQLLAWLLIPLSLLTALDTVDDYLDAQRTAGIVFDRLLLASARTIAQDLMQADGIRGERMPRGAEAFAWPAPDLVYWRVSAANGDIVAGRADLPNLADAPLEPEAPQYRTAQFLGVTVRGVAFLQPPAGAAGGDPLMVEVASTLHGREALAHELWVRNARQQVLILVLAACLAWIGLTRGLGPMLRLGRAVTRRSPDSLEPLPTQSVQSELRPLVSALNLYMSRLGERLEAQRRFIANASHQLRTPLTLLNTQVHYALATQDTEAKDEALRALRDCIRQSNRIANQLLTLSRAETGSGIPVKVNPVDLNEVARLALEKVAALAERRGIDLGFDARGHAVADRATVYGDEVLILEMIVNLVDNAVRYTPPGGQVTITVDHVDGGWRFAVADSGPGIPVHERKHVFERFYRVDGTDGEGSGLGLSIVQEIARACGAVVALGEAEGGHGLLVTVTFPRASAPGARPE
ncbi:MAG TPA: sensor histidine kinase N-terminal domain-containing protein [Casimicrobiaceae bacterium]|nr:sensor histidine kinase N-terminal domain-containing protein [Casimicrobiaceae bacterium]